jgi:uncharacterized protein YcbK (DUF882 family)
MGAILCYPKHSTQRLSKNFMSYEFDCRCGRRECVFTFIDPELVVKLQMIRDRIGVPLSINDAFRCTARQLQIQKDGVLKTAQNVSSHEHGMAADIFTPNLTGAQLEEHARTVGFLAVGTGKSWIHVDTRPDRFRAWFY